MRKTLSLTLAALLFLAATPAFAKRGLQGDWELGPYFGIAWLDDYDRFISDPGAGTTTMIPTDPDDHVFEGFRAGFGRVALRERGLREQDSAGGEE